MNWTLTPEQQRLLSSLEMDWELTPEQQALLSFLELDPESPKASKPRLSDIKLKQFIARRFRELGRPPTSENSILTEV